MVEAGDIVQRAQQLVADLLVAGATIGAVGVEPGSEQADEARRERRVRDERLVDVVHREGGADLSQVGADRTQDDDVTPVHTRLQDERVEAVTLGGARPDREERPLECHCTGVVAPHLCVMQAQGEVGDVPRRAVHEAHILGAIVDHLDAERGEHGQHLGERPGGGAHDPEEPPTGIVASGVQVHRDSAGAVQPLDAPHIGDRLVGCRGVLVRLREGGAVSGEQPSSHLLVVHAVQGVDEPGVPRADRGFEAGVELRDIDRRNVDAPRHPQHAVQLGQRRIPDLRGVLDELGAVRLGEQGLDAESDGRVVPIARHVHER